MGLSVIAAFLALVTLSRSIAFGLALSAVIMLVGAVLGIRVWSSHIVLTDDRIVVKGVMGRQCFIKSDVKSAYLGSPSSGGGFGSSIPIYLSLNNGDRVHITTDVHGSSAFASQYGPPRASEFVGQINKWLKSPDRT